MIGDTLTYENLKAILESMDRIKENDRSDYFKKYYLEVVLRMETAEKDKRMTVDKND